VAITSLCLKISGLVPSNPGVSILKDWVKNAANLTRMQALHSITYIICLILPSLNDFISQIVRNANFLRVIGPPLLFIVLLISYLYIKMFFIL